MTCINSLVTKKLIVKEPITIILIAQNVVIRCIFDKLPLSLRFQQLIQAVIEEILDFEFAQPEKYEEKDSFPNFSIYLTK